MNNRDLIQTDCCLTQHDIIAKCYYMLRSCYIKQPLVEKLDVYQGNCSFVKGLYCNMFEFELGKHIKMVDFIVTFVK